MSQTITIALAGNPNSGKTTIFNALTGLRQHVGNYAGVTVEKVTGRCRHDGVDFDIVDLPGTYSLTAYSMEERVARRFIVADRPRVVVDIVDASNLERNLYLATQLMELGVGLVLALNMSDVARARGVEFDLPRLSVLLGVPIVQTVGNRGIGLDEMMDAALAVARSEHKAQPRQVNYGPEIEEEIGKLVGLLEHAPELASRRRPRWLAVKLLEDDSVVRERVGQWAPNAEKLFAAAEASRRHIQRVFGDGAEIIIADRRYGFISGACQEAVVQTVEARHSMSDRIDAVVTHRVLGIPLFLLLTYLTFQFTFSVGSVPTGWLERLFGWLGGAVAGLWPKASDSPIRSLLTDGIIAGVGGVLTFVPYIMFLFLAISVLEDTGYMARAAFIMDPVMHRIGLHGKSFIPMLVGFGCNVPAIMATRTLDTFRDRVTTMLVIPLMSCSARLVVYTVLIAAFFPNTVLLDLGVFRLRLQPFILFALYLVGVVLAILGAKLLRASVLRGETAPFVMELPPYRIPTFRGLLIHVWERSRLYVKKAGTIILGISVVLWVLTSYPKKAHLAQDYEARQRQAEEAYVQGVRGLAGPLGLGDRADRLVLLAQAELALARAAERCFVHEAGYRDARQRYEATLADLCKGPAGERLACFLDVRSEIERVRREFADEVVRHHASPHSPAYFALLARRDEKLAKLEVWAGPVGGGSVPRGARRPRPPGEPPPTGPASVYAAATAYLDTVRPHYDRAIHAAQHEQEAERLAYSLAGRFGRMLEPLIRPLGFDWKIGTALVGAFGAREVFIAQMGIVYAVGAGEENHEALRQRLRADYSPLVGFCIMLYVLVSVQCVPTWVTTRRESGSWRWALLQLGSLTALAYLLTLTVYQLGRLLGIGTA